MTLVAVIISHSVSSGAWAGTADHPETAFQLTCADGTIAIGYKGVEPTAAQRRWVRYDTLRTTPAFSMTYDGLVSMQLMMTKQSPLRYTLWDEDTEDGRKILKFLFEHEGFGMPPVPGELIVRFSKSTDVLPGFVNVEHKALDYWTDYFGGRSNRVARYVCAPETQVRAYSPDEIEARCERNGRHRYDCEPMANQDVPSLR